MSLLTGFTDEAAAEAALQEQRYRSGVGDYSTYLAASHHLLNAKSTLAGGQRDLGHARLALHRALGGGWTAPDVPVSSPGGRVDLEGLGDKLKALWTKHLTRRTPQDPSAISE